MHPSALARGPRRMTPGMSRIALTLIAAAALAAALAPTASAGPRLSGSERALVGALNDVRAQQGLGRLKASVPLSRAADAHTQDMLARDFFDHPSSDGTSFDARIRRYSDASLLGETLAMTSRRSGGAAAIVQMWMNSPPHRAIMLDARFRKVGVGRRWGTFNGDGYAVVTADFAR
jgi:uncharacterized protein YkwD